jgi:hypothetical protein
MATSVPSGTQFVGLAADYQIRELRSKIINNESQPYTIEDIQTQSVTNSAEFQTQGTDINSTAYLNYGLTHISSVPTVNDYACHLPNPPIQGRQVTIVNTCGIDIVVFPSLPGGTINGITNGSFTVPSNGQAYTFFCYENPAPGAWTISAPATAQVTSGVIEFPNEELLFNGPFTSANLFGVSGIARLKPFINTGTPTGTVQIVINSIYYNMVFNTDFNTTVIDFVNNNGTNILNDTGIYVSYEIGANPYVYLVGPTAGQVTLLNNIVVNPLVGATFAVEKRYSDIYPSKGFCLANNTPDTGVGIYGKSINTGNGGGYAVTPANILSSTQTTYVYGGPAVNPDFVSIQPAFGTTWRRLTKFKIYTNMQFQLNVSLGSNAAAINYTQGANPTIANYIPYNSTSWNNSTGYNFIYPGTNGATFPIPQSGFTAISLQTLSTSFISGVLPGTFVESFPGSNCSTNVGDPGTYYIEATLAIDVYPNITNWIGITKVATQIANPYDTYYSKLIYPVVQLMNPDYFTEVVPDPINTPKFQIFYEYEQL